MRRHIPGLHSGQQDLVSNLDGLFLVGSNERPIVGIRRSFSFRCASASWNPPPMKQFPSPVASTARSVHFGN